MGWSWLHTGGTTDMTEIPLEETKAEGSVPTARAAPRHVKR